MKTQIVKINGKSIMLDVLKPTFFRAYMDVMRKNFDFRELIKNKEFIREKQDNKLYLYGLIRLFGKNFHIKMARFKSKDDEDLFLSGLSKAKEIKHIFDEFGDIIEIST